MDLLAEEPLDPLGVEERLPFTGEVLDEESQVVDEENRLPAFLLHLRGGGGNCRRRRGRLRPHQHRHFPGISVIAALYEGAGEGRPAER